MGRLLAILKKDVRSGGRDSIITYLFVGPFLLAFGFRLLLPVLEEPQVTFAVADDVPAWAVDALEGAGVVELLPADSVRERVLRIDDVPGVVAGDPHPQVLLQGNEAEWVQTVPGLVLDAAGAEIDVAFESLGAEASRLRRIAAALLAFCVLLMGGIAVGLLIIEERETAILRAYATSPLRFGEYVTAKFIGAAAMSLALGPICTAILLGADLPWVPLIVASLASLPAALLLGFIVATVAQDQVAAIAVLKSLLFFFTSLPLFGFFVTGPWALVLSPFSNHWAVQALYLALTPGHGIPWGPLALSLATGVPLVLLVVRVMRRKLGFAGA